MLAEERIQRKPSLILQDSVDAKKAQVTKEAEPGRYISRSCKTLWGNKQNGSGCESGERFAS